MSHQQDRFSLKELQTRKNKLLAELNRLKLEVTERNTALQDANRAVTQCNQKITEVTRQIESMTRTPIVTEHALLRYCQHVLGIDIEAIKSVILSDATLKQVETLGNGKYPVVGGHKAVIKENCVVSIVPDN